MGRTSVAISFRPSVEKTPFTRTGSPSLRPVYCSRGMRERSALTDGPPARGMTSILTPEIHCTRPSMRDASCATAIDASEVATTRNETSATSVGFMAVTSGFHRNPSRDVSATSMPRPTRHAPGRSARTRGGEDLGEAELLHLAGRGDRKVGSLDEAELLRHLEGREGVLAESAQRLGLDGVAVLQHDGGGDDLLLARIRQADHVRLLDGGMAQEHLLDLERRDVDPARLDYLLDPAAKPQPAVVADE